MKEYFKYILPAISHLFGFMVLTFRSPKEQYEMIEYLDKAVKKEAEEIEKELLGLE